MTLREKLRKVLDCKRPDLDIERDEALALCAEIAAFDLCDDDALRAYDLLHARAAYGRAW